MFKEFIQKLFGTKPVAKTNQGKVKFYNRAKGFGFITVEETEDEIFYHKSNLVDRVKENDTVSFDIEKGERGLTAVNVCRVK